MSNDREVEMLKATINALGKQIPHEMKVVCLSNGMRVLMCPLCGYSKFGGHYPKHCPECGQALKMD